MSIKILLSEYMHLQLVRDTDYIYKATRAPFRQNWPNVKVGVKVTGNEISPYNACSNVAGVPSCSGVDRDDMFSASIAFHATLQDLAAPAFLRRGTRVPE